MLVERLSLTGFRSYAQLEVHFPAGPQVVVGPNAAGKTNLLEGLVVLGTGRSHRATTDAEIISWGAAFARLEADVAGAGATGHSTKLEVVLNKSAPGARRRIQVNGLPRRAASLAAALPVVLFAPEDMLLVIGSPSLRRHTLDGLISQTVPEAAATLATYGRAVTQRNNLLKTVREGAADPAELRYWSDVVCREGGRIVEWRWHIMEQLARPLAAAQAEIAPAEDQLSLRYVTNAPPNESETAESALRRRLAETVEKELWNGATLVGPHRDDFSFQLGQRDLAGFGSRGQQRTAILALKLAQLELLTEHAGRPPLLLLDDVFSELDPERRAHLVRRIGALPQAFVTTTTLDDLDASLVAASTSWHVTPGRLEPARAGARSG
ncbi:DNA replication/repair protein RecF [soil metagenome]|jgi:DNA replication and repair protein RecF